MKVMTARMAQSIFFLFSYLLILQGCEFTSTNQSKSGAMDKNTLSFKASSALEIVSAEATSYQEEWGHSPDRAIDGDLGTRWYAIGNSEALTLSLAEESLVDSVEISFFNTHQYDFALVAVDAAGNQTQVYSGQSNGDPSSFEVLSFDPVNAQQIIYQGAGNNNNNWNGIVEVRINGVPIQPSAPLEIVSADATSYQEEWGHSPDRAIDGDLGTRWYALGNSEELTLNLAQESLVDAVEISFFNTHRYDFALVAVDAAGNQTQVYSGQSNGDPSGFEVFSFDPVNAQQIIYQGAGNNNNNWNGIVEVQVIGLEPEGPSTEYVIESVTASSYQEAYNHSPDRAVDGDSGTRWYALGNGEHLDIEFVEEALIESVEIDFFKGDEQSYDFELIATAADGTETTVYQGSSSGSDTGFENFPIDPVVAKSIRYVGSGNDQNNWNGIEEIRFNGQDNSDGSGSDGGSGDDGSGGDDSGGSTGPSTDYSVEAVTASSYQEAYNHSPDRAIDGDPGTRWYALGIGEYLDIVLTEEALIESVEIDFFKGDEQSYDFELIATAADGTETTIYQGSSSGSDTGFENFPITPVVAKSIRYVGLGNNQNNWNGIEEIRFNGQDPSGGSDDGSGDDGSGGDDSGGGNSDPGAGGITPPTTTGNFNIVTEVSQTSCYAPCGVVFDATKTAGANNMIDLSKYIFHWNYGDPGSTFVNGNIQSAETSFGPIGAHVFTQPGTYQVKLTVKENFTAGKTKNHSITVLDPNSISETYCVSTSNNYSGCPSSGSNYRLSNMNQVNNLLNGIQNSGAGPARRILFRKGDTFPATQAMKHVGVTSAMIFGSYGSASQKPLIRAESGLGDKTLLKINLSENTVVTGLNFVGPYNPVTGLGNHPNALHAQVKNKNILIHQNDFSGFGMAFYLEGGRINDNNRSFHVIAADNKATNWQNYATYTSLVGVQSAIIGNSFKQNPNAVSGTEGRCLAPNFCSPDFADHGPIRVSFADRLLIQNNQLFSKTGWDSQGKQVQPTLRLGTAGHVKNSVVSDNKMEGGAMNISFSVQNKSTQIVIGDALIERNELIANKDTHTHIESNYGGVVIRNNLMFKTQSGNPLVGGAYQYAIRFTERGPLNSSNLNKVNHIYNNTYISQATSAISPNAKFVTVLNEFDRFSIYNNLVHTPNATGSDAGFFVLKNAKGLSKVNSNNNLYDAPGTRFAKNNGQSLTLAQWRNQGKGSQSLEGNPQLSDPQNGSALLQPSSPAINAGTSIDGLMLDLFAEERVNTLDMGCYEAP